MINELQNLLNLTMFIFPMSAGVPVAVLVAETTVLW